MKVLVSACLLGAKVRWNGADKRSYDLAQWAESEGIHLVSICPEDALFGTPRPPIRMSVVGEKVSAVFKKRDVLDSLRSECRNLQREHPDAVGFIGVAGSPTCGISVGVRGLGRTIKGAFPATCDFPAADINQIMSEKNRDAFLKRIKKYAHMCKRRDCDV